MQPRHPTQPPRRNWRATQQRSPLPELLYPRPAAPPRRRPVWRQLAIAVVLSLVGLLATSALVDHCAQDVRFCSLSRQISTVTPQIPPPAPKPARVTAAESTQPTRPVLAHAFEPLPLSLDGESTRNFVLPPGRSMLDMATELGRIAVDDVSLIAVVQQDGVRHALVRLPDGRILRLEQGDALQGGTVAAISDGAIYLLGPDMIPRALVLGG